MHVCYAGPKSCPPEIGGIEVFVFEIGRRLASKGIKISVLVPGKKGSAKNDEVEGMRVRNVAAINNRYALKVSMMPQLLKAASRMKPDIFHANDAPSGVVGLARKHWKKTVFTVHGIGVGISEWPFPMRQGARLMQRIATRGADAVTTTDHFTAAWLRKDRDEIYVIPPGVDTQRFQAGAFPSPPCYDSEKTNLLFAGRLTRVKGVDLLVDALRLIPSEDLEKLNVTIIGEGPLAPLVREAARDLKNVHWLRSIPHADIPPYFTNADFFVMPSRSEGLPISMLEAMSSGVPVIGSVVGGISSYFDDNHLNVIGSLTPEGVAQAVLLSISNRSVAEQKARTACQLVRSNFSWDRIAERYLQVYQELFD